MSLHLVSRSALIRRINRRLAKEGRKLITARDRTCCVVDTNRNINVLLNVNLEKYARQIGAISVAEKLAK